MEIIGYALPTPSLAELRELCHASCSGDGSQAGRDG